MRTSKNFIAQAPPNNGIGRPGPGLRGGSVQRQRQQLKQQRGLRDIAQQGGTILPSQANADRINEILERGSDFWLSVELGLPNNTTGTFPSATTAVEYDLIILGAQSDLQLSTIQITDNGKDVNITSGYVPISLIAALNTDNPNINWWPRPYLIRAQTILEFSVTGNGSEENGYLGFVALKLGVQ